MNDQRRKSLAALPRAARTIASPSVEQIAGANMDAYQDDLAYIHDAGFAFHVNGCADQILDQLHRAKITEGSVVDLGCGSGLWARKLDAAGFDVVGVDISQAMIAMCKQRVPAGEFHVGSILDFPLPSCAAVTALGEIFNYLIDKRNNRRQITQLFRRVFDALQSGGLFIFDIAAPGRGAGPTMKHWEGDDWALMVVNEEDTQKQRLTRRITTFRKTGKSFRRHRETHVLQLFPGDEFAQELRETGFRVRRHRGFGAYQFPKGLAGFIARKP